MRVVLTDEALRAREARWRLGDQSLCYCCLGDLAEGPLEVLLAGDPQPYDQCTAVVVRPGGEGSTFAAAYMRCKNAGPICHGCQRGQHRCFEHAYKRATFANPAKQ